MTTSKYCVAYVIMEMVFEGVMAIRWLGSFKKDALLTLESLKGKGHYVLYRGNGDEILAIKEVKP